MNEIVVSYSEIQDARRCALKHELAWVERWKIDPPVDSPRSIGTWWHRVMNAYYSTLKTGGHPKQQSESVVQDAPAEIRDRLQWMLDGYWEQYSFESGYQVIGTEIRFELPLPLIEDGLAVWLKGSIDLLIADKHGVWVDDHKSVDALPYTKSDPIDDQLPLMAWAAHELGHNVIGARYSWTRRKPLQSRELRMTERYHRRLVNVPRKQQLIAAINATRSAFSRYHESVRLHDLAKQNGSSAMLSTPPTTRRTTCRKDCDFERACTAASQGMNLRQQLDSRGLYQWSEERKVPTTPERDR